VTDTGIHPGSGVGNHRNGLTEENLGVKVIGIGVPTVVDAATIVQDSMKHLLDVMEDPDQEELLGEVLSPQLYGMFVTPKDVDETIKYLSFTISEGLHLAFEES
jgi:spore protease